MSTPPVSRKGPGPVAPALRVTTPCAEMRAAIRSVWGAVLSITQIRRHRQILRVALTHGPVPTLRPIARLAALARLGPTTRLPAHSASPDVLRSPARCWHLVEVDEQQLEVIALDSSPLMVTRPTAEVLESMRTTIVVRDDVQARVEHGWAPGEAGTRAKASAQGADSATEQKRSH